MTFDDIPRALRAKAALLGPAGEQWLDALPAMLRTLGDEWDIRPGRVLHGGSAGYVVEAETANGVPAVLKIGLPDFAQEMRALMLGDSPPYAEVFSYDADRGAVLMERLGRPLSRLGLGVEEQLDVVARTLPAGWRVVPGAGLPTGAEKALWLREFIEKLWEEQGRPCSRRTIDRALMYAGEREAPADPASAVLVHGDAHTGNVLETLAEEGVFRLIDPEGLLSEPAHDLAIVLRQWNDELVAADAPKLLSEWCDRLSGETGIAREPIWQWSFIERVSTGLYFAQFGFTEDAAATLEVAELL